MTLGDEILRLPVAAEPSQTIYLNNERVDEQFIAQLESISEWINQTGANAQGEVSVSGVEGNVGTLGDKPLARALVVRETLQSLGAIRSPNDAAARGQYVMGMGRSCLRHPQLEANLPTTVELHGECISGTDQRYQSLEFDRARAEAVRLALAGPASSNDRMWLLVLTEGDEINCAAVLNSRWINDAVISYLHEPWAIFGIFRQRIADVPVLGAIHVWVQMQESLSESPLHRYGGE
jgi:hypothetical protein